MNSVDSFGFTSQERALLEPPGLTARQEYVSGLYSDLDRMRVHRAQIDEEISDKLDEIRELESR